MEERIIFVSDGTARDIIRRRKPLGRFVVTETFRTDKKRCYTAIDNTTGDAWTEDFESLEEAEKWLDGKEVSV